MRRTRLLPIAVTCALISVLVLGFTLASSTAPTLYNVEIADQAPTQDRIGNDPSTATLTFKNIVTVRTREHLDRGVYGPWRTVDVTRNLITNAGQDYVASVLNNNGSSTWSGGPDALNTSLASPVYLAVSNDAGAPAEGDATLTGEITANGLARALADTVTHTKAANTLTLVRTWTATGAQSAQKGALAPHSNANGVIYFEATFTSVTLATNDQLQLTWTITLSGS